jgi:glycopeptide antibiotics resistance protein
MNKSFLLSLLITIGVFLLLSPVFIQLLDYLHPIVLFVVVICMFFLSYFIILFVNKKTILLSYSLFLTLLLVYTLALLILLFLRPNNQIYHSMNLIPFSTIAFYLAGKVNPLISFYNLAANIILFIPYGILLMIKKVSYLRLFVLPFLGIALIEFLQFTTHRGSLDIDDLILNMVGVIGGYLLYPLFTRIFKVTF